jgi:hypothetical protein
MRESRTYGSVREVRSNPHPYRDICYSRCEAAFAQTARRGVSPMTRETNLSGSTPTSLARRGTVSVRSVRHRLTRSGGLCEMRARPRRTASDDVRRVGRACTWHDGGGERRANATAELATAAEAHAGNSCRR